MTYKNVEQWIESHRSELTLTCRLCGRALNVSVYGYPHDDGYKMTGYNHPVWLYIPCSDFRCGHDNALWKLGVPPGTVF